MVIVPREAFGVKSIFYYDRDNNPLETLRYFASNYKHGKDSLMLAGDSYRITLWSDEKMVKIQDNEEYVSVCAPSEEDLLVVSRAENGNEIRTLQWTDLLEEI